MSLARALRAQQRRWDRRGLPETQHPTPTCRAILAQLRSYGMEIPGPDDGWRVRRTYAGANQRSAGAWVWALEWAPADHGGHHGVQVGSIWPAKDCARPGALIETNRYGETSLWPSNAPR